MVFRDQNQWAKKHASEKRSTGPKLRFSQICSPTIRSFSIHPDDAVLNRFSHYCMLAGGQSEGQEVLHAAIPSLYASAPSASPCTPAILALAWVTSAPFAPVSQRMDAARRKYGEAVVKLRNALQNPCTAKADDALFAVILILLLEVLEPFACLFCFRC